VEEMAAKAKFSERVPNVGRNNKAEHMKAYTLWTTEPERPKAREKCGD